MEYGAEAPFLRPQSLSTATARIDGAVRHALEFAEQEEGEEYDHVVLLQNSAPLRTSEDIDWCVKLLQGQPGADSCASAYLAEHEHPLTSKKLDGDGFLVPYSDYDPGLYRRQDQPPVYYMNGAVYAVRRNYLIEHTRVIGGRCLPYCMPHYRSMDVHTKRDLRIAELLLEIEDAETDRLHNGHS